MQSTKQQQLIDIRHDQILSLGATKPLNIQNSPIKGVFLFDHPNAIFHRLYYTQIASRTKKQSNDIKYGSFSILSDLQGPKNRIKPNSRQYNSA